MGCCNAICTFLALHGTHAHTHTRIHTYTHTHAHAHTHTHTHTTHLNYVVYSPAGQVYLAKCISLKGTQFVNHPNE